jgi:rhamnose transport system substrate-binding protein
MMSTKKIAAATVALAVASTVAALLAGASNGAPKARAAHRTYSIAYVTGSRTTPRVRAIARGGRAAARALGVRYILAGPPNGGAQELIPVYKAMIARHVDAIASDGYDPALKPILTKVRKAGILLVSSGDDIAAKRDLWVSHSANVAYAHALADSLASQIQDKGEYAILVQRDEFPVADAWEKIVQDYIPKAYPSMKLDAVIRGSGAGDQTEISSIEQFMSDHPNLRGLIGITPTEAEVAATAITQAHEIGKVFLAGNGGGSFGAPLPGYVRSGVAEFVFASNPINLGYLTVWAAHYLLTGHHFHAGAYQVGGPIGLVTYYPKHRELRLGQPLTITKANVDLYANKF